jgi:hypothetical protein
MSSPVALTSPALLPITVGAAAASPVVIVLDGAAQALAALTGAAQVDATVMPAEAPGALTLLTALGTLAIKTALALPVGTRVVLQAIADRPGAALVVAINDIPTAPRATPLPPTAAALPLPTTSAALPSSVLALGTTVIATVVGTAASPLPESPLVTTPQPTATATATAASGETAGTDPTASGRPAAPAAPASGGSAIVADRATTPDRTDEAAGASAALAPSTVKAPTAAGGDGFRLAASGGVVALRILAVQPAATAGSPAAPALSGIVRPSPPAAAGVLVATPAGPIRLFPAPMPAAGQAAAPLLPGTPVELRLLAGEPSAALLTVLPGDQPSPPSVEPLQNDGQQAVREAPPLGTQAAPAADAAAAPPEHAEFRVLLNAPASTAPGVITTGIRQVAEAAASPTLIVGTVLTSHATPGAAATLIATPLGSLSISEPLALPRGTLLLLALQPDDANALTAPTVDPSSRLDKGWSALEATLGMLDHAAPQLAAHLRADLSTQSGERLAASLMVLVAALRNGTPRAWPGDAVEHALAAAGRDDLKLRLGEEFAEIRSIAENPATNPWQVFLLPLVDGAALRPARLYLKRHGERGRQGADDDSARFILEFELTRLGILQLDGFVRPQRFDLVLRSQAPLAVPLRSAVERIFYDRVAAAGIAGSIDFTAAARFDVAPLDKLRAKVGLAV